MQLHLQVPPLADGRLQIQLPFPLPLLPEPDLLICSSPPRRPGMARPHVYIHTPLGKVRLSQGAHFPHGLCLCTPALSSCGAQQLRASAESQQRPETSCCIRQLHALPSQRCRAERVLRLRSWLQTCQRQMQTCRQPLQRQLGWAGRTHSPNSQGAQLGAVSSACSQHLPRTCPQHARLSPSSHMPRLQPACCSAESRWCSTSSRGHSLQPACTGMQRPHHSLPSLTSHACSQLLSCHSGQSCCCSLHPALLSLPSLGFSLQPCSSTRRSPSAWSHQAKLCLSSSVASLQVACSLSPAQPSLPATPQRQQACSGRQRHSAPSRRTHGCSQLHVRPSSARRESSQASSWLSLCRLWPSLPWLVCTRVCFCRLLPCRRSCSSQCALARAPLRQQHRWLRLCSHLRSRQQPEPQSRSWACSQRRPEHSRHQQQQRQCGLPGQRHS